MITRLIIFLIRIKLGLKIGEKFRFTNQKSKTDYYYFDSTALMKSEKGNVQPSNVSLNWLLSDECSLIRVDKS